MKTPLGAVDGAGQTGHTTPMLRISDISYSVEGRPLLEGASAVIPEGHKVGLVGRNGSGKTTLFRLIRGELSLDGGEIELPKRHRIGGVAQEAPASDDCLLDTVLAADTERAALLIEAETATDPDRIAWIHTRLADIGSHTAEARASAILQGLGFDAAAQLRPCHEFSGGWRMRVALAAVLFSRPDLLLLDEPTNYLDLEGTIWLESYLAKYPATVILISHDRTLLNRAVGGILHLHDKSLTYYTGTYDQFDRERREKLAQREAMARKQDARRKHLQSYVDRFRYKASKAKQAQARLKMIARMEPIAADVPDERIAFNFPGPEELSPPIIQAEDVKVGYDGKPVLSRMSFRIDQDDRIALLGANGQGKSTLAKLLSGRLEPMEGHFRVSSRLRIGFFAQHQIEDLVPGDTPLEHLRRERPEVLPVKLRAQLASFGIGAEIADTPAARLSGGQKSRLALLLATLDAPHLLILDEPTNHLDIESRAALISALNDYTGAVLLISHDPHLIELTADRLMLVKDGTVKPFEDDLEAYRRMLLGDRPAKEKPRAERPKRPSRDEVQALRSDLRKCEARVEKLQDMREKLTRKLSDPDLYQRSPDEFVKWQKKHAEVVDGLERAEELWMEAAEKLEAASG